MAVRAGAVRQPNCPSAGLFAYQQRPVLVIVRSRYDGDTRYRDACRWFQRPDVLDFL